MSIIAKQAVEPSDEYLTGKSAGGLAYKRTIVRCCKLDRNIVVHPCRYEDVTFTLHDQGDSVDLTQKKVYIPWKLGSVLVGVLLADTVTRNSFQVRFRNTDDEGARLLKGHIIGVIP